MKPTAKECLEWCRAYCDPSLIPIVDELLGNPHVLTLFEYADRTTKTLELVKMYGRSRPGLARGLSIWLDNGEIVIREISPTGKPRNMADMGELFGAIETWSAKVPVLTIVVIDDKDHALKQVQHEMPNVDKVDVVFHHFETIAAFRQAHLEGIYLVFLDFFLSKDHAYGMELIPELKCEHLVCFSSMREASDSMYEAALKVDRRRIWHVHSVQKIKETLDNKALRETLAKILGGNSEATNA